MNCVRTNASDPDFLRLVAQLDADLAERDGEDHAFYAQFNQTHLLRLAVLGYEDGIAVACGAIKPFSPEVMEVKRMFVLPGFRGRGHASAILNELERWAAEMGNTHCVLETGLKQPEAIALYHKRGYLRIPNYGQYQQMENSCCFQKILV